MTKNEIIMELETVINGTGFDNSQLIIIGKAAEILITNKDDPTMENIEIWVNPKYYDFMASSEDYIETTMENSESTRNISFSYVHYSKKYGEIRLYRGDIIGPRPKSKQIAGFNVQVHIQEAASANIINFKQK